MKANLVSIGLLFSIALAFLGQPVSANDSGGVDQTDLRAICDAVQIQQALAFFEAKTELNRLREMGRESIRTRLVDISDRARSAYRQMAPLISDAIKEVIQEYHTLYSSTERAQTAADNRDEKRKIEELKNKLNQLYQEKLVRLFRPLLEKTFDGTFEDWSSGFYSAEHDLVLQIDEGTVKIFAFYPSASNDHHGRDLYRIWASVNLVDGSVDGAPEGIAPDKLTPAVLERALTRMNLPASISNLSRQIEILERQIQTVGSAPEICGRYKATF